ncbi:MAG: ABC transporter permease [Cyclobacteriaceae bacterium]|nr:ABC transporter permease [Cyclobacteriaceae bacterium]
MIIKPPKYAERLLLWFLRDDLAEGVWGDLYEKYLSTLKNKSRFRAQLNYWYQVFHYIRPFAIRSLRYNIIQYAMIRSNIKIGWRHLLKSKGYSIINIGGLATGMAVAILIGLWIFDELSFNRYHENYSRIAQVLRNGTLSGQTYTTSWLPYALGDELRTKYGANFKHVLVAWPEGDHILSVGENKLTSNGQFMEAAAPEMFSFRMTAGTRDGLTSPNSILLSVSMAKALFGDSDPLGKDLLIDNRMNVTVTGVYDDFPHNSSLYGVEFVAPWDLFVMFNQWVTTQGFANNFLKIYVEIGPAVAMDEASLNIRDAIVNNVSHIPDFAAVNPQIFLHPMDKWHLHSDFKNGINTGGRIQYVWLFGIVGVFVLILACINFMNLSTARSEKRAKEVGIRKAVGSLRAQLISQFFSESFLIVLLAFLLSVVIVAAALPWFNEISDKQMTMPWTNAWFWGSSLFFILITGLLAGSYPALYLSSFRPVSVLKGTWRAGRTASLPRRALVVVQFTVSVTLIAGTVIVYQQIQFPKDRPVGYDRDGLIMVRMSTSDFYGKLDVLQTALKATGTVYEVAESQSPVTGISSSNGGFDWRGKDPGLLTDFGTLSVSPEYGKTVGWQFVKGRDFSKELASDSSAIVIGESVAALLGFDDPVGELLRWQPVWDSRLREFTIIGVIRDMIARSPYDPPVPTVYFVAGNSNWINIRINPGVSPREALPKIEEVFRRIIPSVPFDYKFADQEYALKFAAEERIGQLATVFAVLAVFISCLGLFGLASFVAEQRTKEIGIRKVVGASLFNLWGMLSRDFVILVMISCMVAIPIAWYFMRNWLMAYEYRVNISWWVFALTGLGALLITLLTVSYQAVRAALMNPVKSLRSE